MIFSKGGKNRQWRKDYFFSIMMLRKLNIYMQKNETRLHHLKQSIQRPGKVAYTTIPATQEVEIGGLCSGQKVDLSKSTSPCLKTN
jgi:hypothetical protein